MLLDFILMVTFTLYTVNTWPNTCDQDLMKGGVFARFVADVVGQNKTMSDLFMIKDTDLIFSSFSAVLLSYVVFLHPGRMCGSGSACREWRKGLLRFRYIGGICFFIVPSLICLAINFICPRPVYASKQNLSEAVGVMGQADVYEQVFKAEANKVTGIEIQFGTYMQENSSLLKCELVDGKTNAVMGGMELDTARLIDNQYIKFEFPHEIDVITGRQYKVRIRAVSIVPGDHFTLYRSNEKPAIDTDAYVLVNGIRQNYDLSIRVIGK